MDQVLYLVYFLIFVILLFCIFISMWMYTQKIILKQRIEIEQKFANDKIAILENYKSSSEFTTLLNIKYQEGHAHGSLESIDRFKKSEGYEALFSVEFSKGKENGAAEERARFRFVYTPIVISEESFFSHKLEIGYDLQIFYNEFPIGDPTRRITEFIKKSKDENINKFLEMAKDVVNSIAAIKGKNSINIDIKTPEKLHK